MTADSNGNNSKDDLQRMLNDGEAVDEVEVEGEGEEVPTAARHIASPISKNVDDDDDWLVASNEEYGTRATSKTDAFAEFHNLNLPFWDTYDTINQLYLELGNDNSQ